MTTHKAATHLQHFCAPVIHSITGESIKKCKRLTKYPAIRELWNTEFGTEWGNLAQGDTKTVTKGKNSLFVLDHNKIKHIPADCIVTHANIVVDYCPQKKDPNWAMITAWDNLINYQGELTTRTAYLTTYKIIWKSIIRTINVKHMCVDIKNFDLCTILDRLEYMSIPVYAFPEHIIKQ